MDYTIKKPYEISLWEDVLTYVVYFYEDPNYVNLVKTEEHSSL
jgi:hypothetical protein